MELQKNQIINGRYKVLGKIGVGGMANVYCAKDLKLERNVTFKVLKEEFLDNDFIKRFSTEAQAAAKISHTNIASVYDVGNENNIYYIVMEYIDGLTLKELIKKKVPFSNEETIGIALQITLALESAHKNGIIHKDIKPQNILVTKDGIVKVTDFGLAKAVASSTITNDNMGSVHYFSPEQARGGYVDNRTDIYSLGIILYEMLTGMLPFDGENTVQLAMKHINEDLPDIKNFNNNVSTSLQKIINKCTRKSVNDRYLTATELNQDLKEALTNENGDFINFENKNQQTRVISKQEVEKINNLQKKQKHNTRKINKNKKYDYDKYMKKRVTLFAIFTAIIIMTITSGFTFFYLHNLTTVKVPTFIGKTWEQAVKSASQNEIYIENVKEEYSSEYKAGIIMEQSVEANSKIKKGETVQVTISLGSDNFIMPNFINKDISEVYEKLADYEVNLTEEYLYSDEVEIGKVIKQNPKSGSKVKFKDDIKLYISKGSENTIITTIVPDLSALSLENARIRLKDNGLTLGKVTYTNSNASKDTVISQSIKPGTEVEQGKSVNLVISQGPKADIQNAEQIEQTQENQTTQQPQDTENLNTSKNEQSQQDSVTSEEEISQTPVIKRESLTIQAPQNIEGETVEVKVVQINSSGAFEIYLNTHSISEFPLNISVSGNEPTEYQIYINGNYQTLETKSFN